jgi:hypothetical protein
LDAAISTLSEVCSSTLYKNSVSSLEALTSSLGISAELVLSQPSSFDANICFWQLISRQCGAEQLMALASAQKRLELFTEVASHSYAESRLCADAGAALSSGVCMSPLQRSVLFSQNAVSNKPLQEWEVFAWPFLSALGDDIRTWLALSPATASKEEDTNAVQAIAAARADLWDALSSPAVSQEEAVWRWEDIFKQMRAAAAILPWSDRLSHIGSRLLASLASLNATPTRFWRAVRPMPFRKAASWRIHHQIVELGNRM